MGARRELVVLLNLVVLCAWCGWASSYRLSTWQSWATWLASLLVVVAAYVAISRGRRGLRLGLEVPAVARWQVTKGVGPGNPVGVSTALVRLSPWLLLALAILTWEALGIDTGTHAPHLTISALSQTFRALHAALLAVWMAVGIGYAIATAGIQTHGRTAGDPSGSGVVAGLLGGWSERAANQYRLVPGPDLSHRTAVLALLLGRSRAVGVAFWVGVAICSALIETAARHSHERIPDFLRVLELVSRPVPARLVLIAAWTFAGWHLFAH
ncbi:MAG: hypothetical protein ACYCST_13245 [Acidimicrobiales bacterium]